MQKKGKATAISLLAIIFALTSSWCVQETYASENEKVRLRKERISEITKKYDLSGDGYLDSSEKELLMKDRQIELRKLKAILYSKYDLNKNGELEPEELDRIREYRARLAGARGKALEEFDEDADGSLDDQEKAKLNRQRDEWIKRIKQQALDRFDTNKDGVLDAQEKVAMKALVEP